MASELVSRVFEAVDSGDAPAFSRFFSERGRLVFANGLAMVGPAELEAGARAFFGTIGALRHTVKNRW